MRTLGELFIITALLALAVAFTWKHFTKSAPNAQSTAATIGPPASTTPAQHRTTHHRMATASTSAPVVDKAQAFQALKKRAKAGDAVAQRLLAQAYDACFVMNVDRQRIMTGIHQQLRTMTNPEHASTLERLARARAEQCDAVDDGDFVPRELVIGWFAQAAENGDLPAQAMSAAFQHKQYDTASATRLLEDVVASGDPAAVYSLGSVLGGSLADNMGEPYKSLVTGPTASYAWILAGCRMGYDCGPDSTEVGNMCLLSNRCLGESYEQMVFATTQTQQERDELERHIQRVLDAVTP